MDQIYLFIVIFLFILAISDLMVGVSNDAVNFLYSAIGAQAAPFRIIMLVAILGILAGTTFSSGMMEIARSGIFFPSQFHFSEIMIIFLAVMITDVLLLDTFSSFGLPTSTTVSIIFELLGASVIVAILKIIGSSDTLQEIGSYINAAKSLAIIAGILLSVVIAFTVGTIVQFFSRLLFTFNFEPRLKFLGGIWGGFAVTAITYFMVIKGARGASFMSPELVNYIESNAFLILLLSFTGWTVIFQLLITLFRTNVLRIIVLIGTFALAMAFAGNDLVNFIGVPLAGYESFRIFINDPASDPNQFLMGSLMKPIATPTYLLLLAGAVMSLTLIYSRKARTVINTSVDLSRQEEGTERFGSTALSRNIVRLSMNIGEGFNKVLPARARVLIHKRLKINNQQNNDPGKKVSFDMVRASVNLVVASILIALGTSLKLPLSTTYVTFMVAMGSSFADGAWGRESAVYRITGVLSVIGGWFITAIVAFTASLIIALIMLKGGVISMFIVILVAVLILVRQQISFRRREAEKEKAVVEEETVEVLDKVNMLIKCTNNIIDNLGSISELYSRLLKALFDEDRKQLKEVQDDVEKLNKHTKKLKDNIYKTVDKLREDSVETGHYYVQALDYLREIAHCVNYISEPCFEHVNNNHKGLSIAQKSELTKINQHIAKLINLILEIIQKGSFARQDEAFKLQVTLLDLLDLSRKAQVKRIKNHEAGTKNSLLYLNILAETKNLALFMVNLLKSHRDFVIYTNDRLPAAPSGTTDSNGKHV
jgi:phosphate/sulfate permease